MKPHQKRVIEEKEELDKKISALQKFVEGETIKDLSVFEQQDLKSQMYIMSDYSQILKRRINRF